MISSNASLPLPLMGGVVQAQRLVLPVEVIARIESYREACRLAWKLRRTRMSQRTFAEVSGLYAPHVSDYFSAHEQRRELPARHIPAAESALGNTVISQWLAYRAQLTVLEGLQAQQQRRAA